MNSIFPRPVKFGNSLLIGVEEDGNNAKQKSFYYDEDGKILENYTLEGWRSKFTFKDWIVWSRSNDFGHITFLNEPEPDILLFKKAKEIFKNFARAGKYKYQDDSILIMSTPPYPLSISEPLNSESLESINPNIQNINNDKNVKNVNIMLSQITLRFNCSMNCDSIELTKDLKLYSQIDPYLNLRAQYYYTNTFLHLISHPNQMEIKCFSLDLPLNFSNHSSIKLYKHHKHHQTNFKIIFISLLRALLLNIPDVLLQIILNYSATI